MGTSFLALDACGPPYTSYKIKVKKTQKNLKKLKNIPLKKEPFSHLFIVCCLLL